MSRCKGIGFAGDDILTEIFVPTEPLLEAVPVFIHTTTGADPGLGGKRGR